MQTNYKKKFVGTALIAIVIAGLISASIGVVNAQFISNAADRVRIDGQVVNKTDDYIELDTNGTDTFKVYINDRTRFQPNRNSWLDIDTGDVVHVQGQFNDEGNIEASRIRLLEDTHTYGSNPGVRVLNGTVVAKGANSFTVRLDDSDIDVVFTVDSSTRFVRTNFPSLEVGDEVLVRGQDTGANFYAQRVIRRP
ncbi:MAG TPA: DUF5666 domain-containing protein [Verrucomicrobiae bacterium]|nr:DUF5666 domain-containing protein [Verrucomicrobiae bacterium]